MGVKATRGHAQSLEPNTEGISEKTADSTCTLRPQEFQKPTASQVEGGASLSSRLLEELLPVADVVDAAGVHLLVLLQPLHKHARGTGGHLHAAIR